jgi:hypothetical protein
MKILYMYYNMTEIRKKGYNNGVILSEYKRNMNSPTNYYTGFKEGVRKSPYIGPVQIIIMSALQANSILRKPSFSNPEYNTLWRNTFYASYRNRPRRARPNPVTPAKTVSGFALQG